MPVARLLMVLAAAQLNDFLRCKKLGFKQCSPKDAQTIKRLKTLLKASQLRVTPLSILSEILAQSLNYKTRCTEVYYKLRC